VCAADRSNDVDTTHCAAVRRSRIAVQPFQIAWPFHDEQTAGIRAVGRRGNYRRPIDTRARLMRTSPAVHVRPDARLPSIIRNPRAPAYVRSGMTRTPVLLAAALVTMFPPAAARGQTPALVPADTFLDSSARDLVTAAFELRGEAAAGLLSYEATVIERVHVGMAVTRRLPLRDRTLYHREEVARAYWREDGRHKLLWIGRREGTPTFGDDWSNDAPFNLGFDVVEELGLDDIGVDLLFDPFGDRLDVFEAEVIQPVSRTGLRTYRFRSGDTMQIRLPAPDRTITLVEVIAEPRETAWQTVEGSLWFDLDTGVLVRAAYRPSGVWDHEVREPHSLEDVPGLLKPGIGTVTSIVIEYGLYERRWWLPRRISGEGEFDWGHGLVRMPLSIEWSMSDHTLNEAPGPRFSEDLTATGIRRRGNDSRRETIDLFQPAGVDLADSAELPPPLSDGELIAFSRDEIEPLIRRIEQVAGPPPGAGQPALGRALLTSLRFDRVRGLSAAWTTTLEPDRFAFTPHLRLASAVPDVEARLSLSRGAFDLNAYRLIADASDWNIADGLGNSAMTLLFGNDGGDYYRVAGASLGFRSVGPGATARVELFAETHRSIGRQTNASLATLGGGSLRPNLDPWIADRPARHRRTGGRAQLEAFLRGGSERSRMGPGLRSGARRGTARECDVGRARAVRRHCRQRRAGATRVSAGRRRLDPRDRGERRTRTTVLAFPPRGRQRPAGTPRHRVPGCRVGRSTGRVEPVETRGGRRRGRFARRWDVPDRPCAHSAAWRMYFVLDALL
jgi:hypothetical protein